jgi:hypothetical protein
MYSVEWPLWQFLFGTETVENCKIPLSPLATMPSHIQEQNVTLMFVTSLKVLFNETLIPTKYFQSLDQK